MTFYKRLESLPLIGFIFRGLRGPLLFLLFWVRRLTFSTKAYWRHRTQDVLRCPDNIFIHRVDNAGEVIDGQQVMHNGIRIIQDSYYGEMMRYLLRENCGVHEPQEERVFQEVLKYLPDNAVMIELGSYWGFYSMWFHKEVKHPTCYLVEPNLCSLEFGQANFRLNGMKGDFFHSFIGKTSGVAEDGTPIISIDSFITDNQIAHVHILHSDIQGAEMEMLLGAEQTLEQNRIDFIFISTHAQEIHEKVLQFLNELNFHIVAEADLAETFSVDGLIAAVRDGVNAPDPIPIARKR